MPKIPPVPKGGSLTVKPISNGHLIQHSDGNGGFREFFSPVNPLEGMPVQPDATPKAPGSSPLKPLAPQTRGGNPGSLIS